MQKDLPTNSCVTSAIKSAEHYFNACDVPCQVIDVRGMTSHLSGLVLAIDAHQEDVHLYGCYQSERFGGRYVYSSPNGLTYWASPILQDGEVVGALVAGPVRMGEPDDLSIDEILARSDVLPEDLPEIRALIQNLPTLSTERVHSLSEMLFLVARALSDDTFTRLEKPGTAEIQDEWHEQTSLIKTFDYSVQDAGSAYPLEKERQLLERVEAGDKAGAQVVLNEILGDVFFARNASQPVILTRVIELVVLLSRAAIRGGADAQQIFGQNFACLNKIHSFRTVDEIAYWLSGIMARFTDQVFNLANVKHADMIFQAKEYVKKNYMNRITLEEVAAHVYLSSAYFSRIFKDVTGENFNVYVNRVRIEAAKKYLVDEKKSMNDISISTGFEDQSYFSKVFKRVTGVTPNKYRESRGRAVSSNKS